MPRLSAMHVRAERGNSTGLCDREGEREREREEKSSSLCVRQRETDRASREEGEEEEGEGELRKKRTRPAGRGAALADKHYVRAVHASLVERKAQLGQDAPL